MELLMVKSLSRQINLPEDMEYVIYLYLKIRISLKLLFLYAEKNISIIYKT